MGWLTDLGKAVGLVDDTKARERELARRRAEEKARLKAHCEVLKDHGDPVPLSTAGECRYVGVELPTQEESTELETVDVVERPPERSRLERVAEVAGVVSVVAGGALLATKGYYWAKGRKKK